MYEMQHHTWNTAAHLSQVASSCMQYDSIHGSWHSTHMPRFPAVQRHTRTPTTLTYTTTEPQNLNHHTQLQLPLAELSIIMYGKLQDIVHGTRHSVLIVVTQRTTPTRSSDCNSEGIPTASGPTAVSHPRSLSSPCPSTRLCGDSVEAANVWLLNVAWSPPISPPCQPSRRIFLLEHGERRLPSSKVALQSRLETSS
jgi:hypothetical protein